MTWPPAPPPLPSWEPPLPPSWGAAPPPWQAPPPRAGASTSLVLARVFTIVALVAVAALGSIGPTAISALSTMSLMGCSDNACSSRMGGSILASWVGLGVGLVAGLVGVIAHWRSQLIWIWGPVAAVCTGAGLWLSLRLVGVI